MSTKALQSPSRFLEWQRLGRMGCTLLVLGYVLLLPSQAAAALFDDDEARKQIVELRNKTEKQQQDTLAMLDALRKSQQMLEQRIISLEAVVKGQGLLDLLTQVEKLNQELSVVKGQLEVATHQLELTQQRQKDLYADMDGRVRKLETGATSMPSSAAPTTEAGASAQAAEAAKSSVTMEASNVETRDYLAAQELFKAGKYKEAFDAYDKFLQSYPKSSKAADAQYSLGFVQFSLKNYKASIATQQKLIAQFPDSERAADASYSIANSYIQLSDVEAAKKALKDTVAKYPNSEAAQNAKRRLAALESIKK